MLFDEKQRTYAGFITSGEGSYKYYDRSCRQEVSTVRGLLNAWFQNYPPDGRQEIVSRFLKADFSSAFFELFIHELLIRQGFDLQLHPPLPNSPHRPDFLVKQGDWEFYVEAVEVKDLSDDEKARANKEERFFEGLNRLKSAHYYLQIQNLEFLSDRQPRTTNIVSNLSKKLNDFDYQGVLALAHTNRFDELPTLEYSDNDVYMAVRLLPVDIPSEKDEIVGIRPFQTIWGGPENALLSSIRKKSKKYGPLDKPLILFLNYLGKKTLYEDDVINLLRQAKTLGSEKISALFITKVHEFNVHVAKYWLVKCPNARLDIDLEHCEMSYFSIVDGKPSFRQGRMISEIFELPDDWIMM
ncbi:hypothetical protein SAMN05216327_104172 [Dyadobacter sp. SG02]|uniref:hypothetical protein n=1 Tax=Dyadobacter sp. SG02 TaxID=1855291 RepID=UPI0008CF671E|nr:hypothetical protein [Dyadobacter sp. SG02]SEI83950.1 hypothetical protein SAMN05216327_104172 [Dyadobacter sp. SG02]